MRVLLTVSEPKSVYGYIRRALADGKTVSYLSTQSSTDYSSTAPRFWASVQGYFNSNKLSIRSASDYYPRQGKRGFVRRGGTSKVPLSGKNSIVMICPSAVSTYLRIRLDETQKDSVRTGLKGDTIVYFENWVADQFPGSTLFCCVLDRFVQSLDIVSLLLLMKHHDLASRTNSKVMPLVDNDIIEAIRTGLDSVLGNGTSTLMLRTLKHVYRINEDAVMGNPIILITKLEKVLGEKVTNMVESAASKELRKIILPE